MQKLSLLSKTGKTLQKLTEYRRASTTPQLGASLRVKKMSYNYSFALRHPKDTFSIPFDDVKKSPIYSFGKHLIPLMRAKFLEHVSQPWPVTFSPFKPGADVWQPMR